MRGGDSPPAKPPRRKTGLQGGLWDRIAVMLLLAFAVGACFGMFVILAVSIFAVGKAFDRAEQLTAEQLTAAAIDRASTTASRAANDPDFAIPASISATQDATGAATAPNGTPPPPTPQPPEVRSTGAILARPRCRLCSQIRRFAAKLRI